MANFDNGVARYIIGRAVVTVGFPVDAKGNAEIACKHCPFYVRALQRCGLNQEMVNFTERYVGTACPLERIENDEV